ncbi:MAG: signal peptidase I [Firmicutes bacterium]|nr:signal peptidase I [Bacillota bacterium]
MIGMSDTNKRLIPIYILLFIYFIISFFISFTTSKLFLYLSPLLLLFISLVTYYITKGFNIRNRNKYTKNQNVIIIIISYCIIYYLSGLVFGFLKSGYSLSISGIISNFIAYFSVVLLKEYIRYRMIFTTKKKTNLILITGLFVLLDIEFNSLFRINSSISGFEYLFKDLVPIIITNITSSYLIYRIGSLPNYIYRGILSGIVLFSPIIPNLNWLVNNLFLLILLIILVFSIDYLVDLEEKRIRKRKIKQGNTLGTYCLFGITVIFVLFVVGIFKYQPIAILSNSMKGSFSKGDAVVVEKIDKDDLSRIKKDDVIYYKYDGRYITHRVIEIEEVNGSYIFYTKGDNNLTNDEWKVHDYMVEGIICFSVKYVGWPSVWLNSLVK